MTFAAIADWAASEEFLVAFMCTELAVSRSGYYAWRRGEPSQRSRDDTTYTAPIRKIYREGRGNPGGSDRPVPAPDLLGRDCTAGAPDTRWCGDITYVTAGPTSRPSSTCTPAPSWVGPPPTTCAPASSPRPSTWPSLAADHPRE
ncbi:hypothetical protein [Frankia sp. Cas4]|uniref:hypothetical protein n=1 Tax=Frankia sp. Cas4 TaxID=3073927 RepID=UPI002AD31D52|nr:hypothetical protein [Frankia sp. Cas4]